VLKSFPFLAGRTVGRIEWKAAEAVSQLGNMVICIGISNLLAKSRKNLG